MYTKFIIIGNKIFTHNTASLDINDKWIRDLNLSDCIIPYNNLDNKHRDYSYIIDNFVRGIKTPDKIIFYKGVNKLSSPHIIDELRYNMINIEKLPNISDETPIKIGLTYEDKVMKEMYELCTIGEFKNIKDFSKIKLRRV